MRRISLPLAAAVFLLTPMAASDGRPGHRGVADVERHTVRTLGTPVEIWQSTDPNTLVDATSQACLAGDGVTITGRFTNSSASPYSGPL